MKSTYVDTRSANVGDIRCLFALASDSTSIGSSECRDSTNPHQVVPFFHIYYLYIYHINNVLCVLRDKFAWIWLLEGILIYK